MIATSIPSPPVDWQVLFSIGPLNVHAYAICILIGIGLAVWLTTRRWVERGGNREVVGDVGMWAIPFGIVGGRLYHVISSPDAYFGENGNPAQALRIWDGGLGIWGAVALGALGAWIGCKRAGVSFLTFMDAAAPGVLFAQAIGRIGNWFNQELFGAPTDLPWGLEIDLRFRPEGYEGFTTFHPTFLYELLWNVAGAFLILYLDKRLRLWGGRVFWLYVFVYTLGRVWIENVRIDDAEIIGGLRVNVWVSIIVLLGSGFMFWWLGKRQREAGAAPDRATLGASNNVAVEEAAADAAPAKAAPAKVTAGKASATKASTAKNATAAKAPAAKQPSAAKKTTTASATTASATTASATTASATTASATTSASTAAKKPAAAKPAGTKAPAKPKDKPAK